MEFIKGKYRSSIFSSETGYKIGLFRVKETSEALVDLKNKIITFTGYFHELNADDLYLFYGEYVYHERYGYQFQVSSYERIEPEGKDAIVDFLTSKFVKGCGEKTAKKIVEVLGDNAIQMIKEDKNVLLSCGLTVLQAEKIHTSIMSYYDSDEVIIYLKSLDFSVKEITKMLSLYGNVKVKNIVQNDLYSLVEFIDFSKLDKIYFKIYEETNEMRILACLIEVMKRLTFNAGDTYLYREELITSMWEFFQIDVTESFDAYIEDLENKRQVVKKESRYYLFQMYEDEQYICNAMCDIMNHDTKMSYKIEDYLISIEKEFGLSYNDEQKKAMKEALTHSICLITGGPGTGKTTIINGLLRLYQHMNGLTDLQMNHAVALLAPTGRASKRMSETTNYGASTIHRYLKWNHETREFGVNEYNPNEHSLIIIDEISMVDNELMANLLRGIKHDCKLVIVGDEHQLPSVGPGNILKDLISSDMFSHVHLENIYRQSDNSFIPILASEIKNVEITSDIREKKDDYNFLECEKSKVKIMLKEIIHRSVQKGIKEKDIQVLAPMYKGENGIDNLNIILQEIFNPYQDHLEEVHIGPTIFRVGDKVINLVNDIEQNIFNGDIGYIKEINVKKASEFMKIDFYGNPVVIKREQVSQIRHAYAMSIHKSQGSEFNHVIIPMTREYQRMLYNRLLYTGISRAKKSLVLIGDANSFLYAVHNSYSVERKTTLKEFIMHKYD